MIKAKIHKEGTSSGGAPHGLLVEAHDDGSFRYVVTGKGGKRHAAVTLQAVDSAIVADFIGDAYTEDVAAQ
jgi:hypothetical protein